MWFLWTWVIRPLLILGFGTAVANAMEKHPTIAALAAIAIVAILLSYILDFYVRAEELGLTDSLRSIGTSIAEFFTWLFDLVVGLFS